MVYLIPGLHRVRKGDKGEEGRRGEGEDQLEPIPLTAFAFKIKPIYI